LRLRFSEKQNQARKALQSPARFVCLFGGARSGKTFLIIRAIIIRALRAPGSRHLIARFRQNAVWTSIAGDANATLFVVAERCFDGMLLVQHRQDGYFELPGGSTIWLGGLDDKERVDKILGREYSSVYLNEASEIPYSSVLIALTRLAEVRPEIRQRAYIDLNPVGKSHWTNRMFLEHRDPISMQPHADPRLYESARLNPIDNIHNLTPEFIAYLNSLPEKQRKRFLEGEYVDEVEGALWAYENIELNRRTRADIANTQFKRLVVGVDPSGAANKDDKHSDEIGIVVAGLGFDEHAYVLADRTARCGPVEWARIAVNAYQEFRADRIVAEDNFGGEMVAQTIREVDRAVPVRRVHASRGKAVRAEPVSARYALGEVHHVGRFPELEDQLCAFSPAGYQGPNSPDRADALVWALTELMGDMVLSFHVPIVASRPIQVPG
jgi:phage terminase large subunit-like protein